MYWRGRLAYSDALGEMKTQRDALLSGEESAARLILCEHDPVITCGRRSHSQNVLLSRQELDRRGIQLVEIERGGDVTYHGPGQLMVYPIVRVGLKVSAFLEELAQALADVAASYGVPGARWRRDEPGLWLADRKLAACGLHLSRGVCIHGFSLNVATPPEAWRCIVPCGLSGPGPVSLVESLPSGHTPPSIAEVARRTEARLLETLAPYGLRHEGAAGVLTDATPPTHQEARAKPAWRPDS